MVVDERRKEVSDDQLLMRNGDARADVIDLFSGIQIVGFPRAGVSGGQLVVWSQSKIRAMWTRIN